MYVELLSRLEVESDLPLRRHVVWVRQDDEARVWDDGLLEGARVAGRHADGELLDVVVGLAEADERIRREERRVGALAELRSRTRLLGTVERPERLRVHHLIPG